LTPRQRLESLKSRASVADFWAIFRSRAKSTKRWVRSTGRWGTSAANSPWRRTWPNRTRARRNAARHRVGSRRARVGGALPGVERHRAAQSESRGVLPRRGRAGGCANGRRIGAPSYLKSEPANPHVPVTLEHLALAHALDGDFERAARLEGYVNGPCSTSATRANTPRPSRRNGSTAPSRAARCGGARRAVRSRRVAYAGRSDCARPFVARRPSTGSDDTGVSGASRGGGFFGGADVRGPVEDVVHVVVGACGDADAMAKATATSAAARYIGAPSSSRCFHWPRRARTRR